MSLGFATVKAATVDVNATRRVAAAFWNTNRPAEVKAIDENALFLRDCGDLTHMHIYSVQGTGFVIVSATNAAVPILAYSFDSPFPEEIHPSLRYMLNGYESQLRYADSLGLTPSSEVQDAWDALAKPTGKAAGAKATAIAPMVTTRWDQGSPYNKFCPYDSVSHVKTVVGCVATAMAQIIRFWKHPSCGTGSHSYLPEQRTQGAIDTLTADFENTTYIYAYMPYMVVADVSPVREVNAVATLSYHCGVAVDMMYGSSSGAYTSCGYWSDACAVSAFVDYFKYDPDIQFAERYNYSDSAWREKIETDIAAGRPIYYSGRDQDGGHAFVLDGMDQQRRYHFNFGWGGYGDGYFNLSNIAPISSGTGSNPTNTFNYSQSAIFNIKPIPTVLDTVDVYDTVCYDATSYTFYEYTLTPANNTFTLVHLDTVYRLHLNIAQRRFVYLNANGGMGGTVTTRYCYLNGYVVPECTFTKEGYRFVGWSTSPDGEDVIHNVGDTINVRRNLVLYAIWQNENLGLEEVQHNNVDLWPNPTTGDINISAPDLQGASLEIFDATGRTVLRTDNLQTLGGAVQIPLHALPVGAYTMRIATANGLYNQRIIKR